MIEFAIVGLFLLIVLLGFFAFVLGSRAAFIQAKENARLSRHGSSWLRELFAPKVKDSQADIEERRKDFRFTLDALFLTVLMILLTVVLGGLLSLSK